MCLNVDGGWATDKTDKRLVCNVNVNVRAEEQLPEEARRKLAEQRKRDKVVLEDKEMKIKAHKGCPAPKTAHSSSLQHL